MNEPSSRDLLGYMLGALESDEHQQLEDQIEQDPELKEELHELRSQVALLDELSPPGPAPAGLARRTHVGRVFEGVERRRRTHGPFQRGGTLTPGVGRTLLTLRHEDDITAGLQLLVLQMRFFTCH